MKRQRNDRSAWLKFFPSGILSWYFAKRIKENVLIHSREGSDKRGKMNSSKRHLWNILIFYCIFETNKQSRGQRIHALSSKTILRKYVLPYLKRSKVLIKAFFLTYSARDGSRNLGVTARAMFPLSWGQAGTKINFHSWRGMLLSLPPLSPAPMSQFPCWVKHQHY